VKTKLKELGHFSIIVGGGLNPPHIKNEVLGGQWSSVASSKLCAMFPPKTYSDVVSNFYI